jgi:hypothetical protein
MDVWIWMDGRMHVWNDSEQQNGNHYYIIVVLGDVIGGVAFS